MTLEEVIRTAIIACGAAREVDLADPIAKAVRDFLGSEEAVQRAAAAIKSDVSARYKFEAQARAALSSIGGE